MKEKLAMYRVTAVWRPGMSHKIVDCFSRYPTDDPTEEDLEGKIEIEQVHHVAHLIAATDYDTGETLCEDVRLDQIRAAAREDPEYTSLIKTVSSGFPQSKKKLPPDLQP